MAERAGVSVGTLYQCYPNKQALLFALLDDALDKSAEALEMACEEARSRPLLEMISHVVQRFVDAKMVRTDISTALYQLSVDLGGPALVKRMVERSEKALAAMIQTAPDISLAPEGFAVHMTFSAMAGAMRSQPSTQLVVRGPAARLVNQRSTTTIAIPGPQALRLP